LIQEAGGDIFASRCHEEADVKAMVDKAVAFLVG